MLDYQINESIQKAYSSMYVNEDAVDTVKDAASKTADITKNIASKSADFIKSVYTNDDGSVSWKDIGIDAALLAGALGVSYLTGGLGSGAVAGALARTTGRAALKSAAKAAAKTAAKSTFKNAAKQTGKGMLKGYAINTVGNDVGDRLEKGGHGTAGKAVKLAGNIAAVSSIPNNLFTQGLSSKFGKLGLAAGIGGNIATDKYVIDRYVPDGVLKDKLKSASDYTFFGAKSPMYDGLIDNGIDVYKKLHGLNGENDVESEDEEEKDEKDENRKFNMSEFETDLDDSYTKKDSNRNAMSEFEVDND